MCTGAIFSGRMGYGQLDPGQMSFKQVAGGRYGHYSHILCFITIKVYKQVCYLHFLT